MRRRDFLAGASALAFLTATNADVSAAPASFPGDTAGWAAVYGLKTLKQSVYEASFSADIPCLDYVVLDGSGTQKSSGTIYFKKGKLDVAAIIAAQEAGGDIQVTTPSGDVDYSYGNIITDRLGVPVPYCSDRQIFVKKWYDQSGGQNHAEQPNPTPANMPVLAVIDGEPHLLFGSGVWLGKTSAALSFSVANVTVAACCQPYVTGSGGIYNGGSGALFSLSSVGDPAAVMLTMPASISTTFQPDTSLGSKWLIGNAALQLKMPSVSFRINKTSVTLSSGTGAIEIGASGEVPFSTSSNPFAPYPNVSGTGIVIGTSAVAGTGSFIGYIDAFMVKAGAANPSDTASYRSALDSAFGVNVDESCNVVIEGDFAAWGVGGLYPYIPGSAQGQPGYGLAQFYMAKLVKNARFNSVGANAATWSDYNLRAAVINGMYRDGAQNVIILQNVGSVTDPGTYTAAVSTWVSMLRNRWNWKVIVVDLPDINGDSNIRAINVAVRAAAAQGGYVCVPSLTPTSWQNALARYTSQQLWGAGFYAPNLSAVGYSVLAAAQLPGINAAVLGMTQFPGDPAVGDNPWAAIYGLKPMTKAVYDASFTSPWPCVEYVVLDGDGNAAPDANPTEPKIIYFKDGTLDTATIVNLQGLLNAQGGPAIADQLGKMVPYCASYQVYVTKWYDQSGGNSHLVPATQAWSDMPVLAVIDGEPHLLFSNAFNNHPILAATNARLQFSKNNVTVAACCQPYATGYTWGPTVASPELFSLTSAGGSTGFRLTAPITVASGPVTAPYTAYASTWLFENGVLYKRLAPANLPWQGSKFRVNKTSVTLSSGITKIEVGASDEYVSADYPDHPENYAQSDGLVLGHDFIGYIDAFMIKAGVAAPTQTQVYRTVLDCAFGVKVDESFNFVFDGPSGTVGTGGIFPYIPGDPNAQSHGALGYGATQFFMAGICKHGRFNNIGTRGAGWADLHARTEVVRNLHRTGATNILIIRRTLAENGTGPGGLMSPTDNLQNLQQYISAVGSGWTILVVDHVDLFNSPYVRDVTQMVRDNAAANGYTCISTLPYPPLKTAADYLYGVTRFWAQEHHTSPVGFAVWMKPEIVDINDFLRT